jgi:hypothetical protein
MRETPSILLYLCLPTRKGKNQKVRSIRREGVAAPSTTTCRATKSLSGTHVLCYGIEEGVQNGKRMFKLREKNKDKTEPSE